MNTILKYEYYGDFNKLNIIDNINKFNKINFKIVSKYYLNFKIPEDLIRKINKYIFSEYDLELKKISIKKIDPGLIDIFKVSIQKIFLNFKNYELFFKFNNIKIISRRHSSDKYCICKFSPGKDSKRIYFYRFILKLLRLKFQKNDLDNRITKCIFYKIFYNNSFECYSRGCDGYNNRIAKKIVVSLRYIRIQSSKKITYISPIFKLMRIY